MSGAPASATVAIAGAGLAGAVVARRLAEAGLDVVCLEQGGWPDPASYPAGRADAELQGLGPWHPSPNVRGHADDVPVNDAGSAMKPLAWNGVGGSTVVYGAQWMRLLPADLRVRSEDGVADDWPLAWDELAPYYARVDRDFGVSGAAGDPAYPPKPAYPGPALPIEAWGRLVAAAHDRLGWHWWPGSNAIASRPTEGRAACIRRGTCGMGCDVGAKASVDVTHWPVAIRHGARLVTGARVRRVELAATGRACGLLWRDRGGVDHRLRADIVVLAAGAIGTPRLLLLSADPRTGKVPANRSGLVGRRLMMHPFARVAGSFAQPMASWQGAWGQQLYSLEFGATDARRGFVRGAKWNLGPGGGPLTALGFPGPNRWGAGLHEWLAGWLGRTAIWGITADDLPVPANQVTLDPDLQDGDGLPAPRLAYEVSENSRRILAFNVARAAESMREAGAVEVHEVPLLPAYGWHPLGTCRMGDDPDTSVVDRDGAGHDVPNLWVADASTFVTGGSVNPAATVAALALRAAERLLARRASLAVAA